MNQSSKNQDSAYDYYALKKEIQLLSDQFAEIKASISTDKLRTDLETLREKTLVEGFWNNPDDARKVMWEQNNLSGKLDSFSKLDGDIHDLVSLLEGISADDTDEVAEIVELYLEIQKNFTRFLYLDLFKPIDESNAIVSIKPGAGGLESTDWAQMLMKMYLRYCEKKGFTVEVTEVVPCEGAGIKEVTFIVKGEWAYGLLKYETGIHRLVRISPFDSNARRHTSFASFYCYPEVADTIEVDINPVDLRIETYRSGGAGGQHVNTTDSAVRITHVPSKIVVSCQNERSQHKNRETAMKILRSRLYQYYIEEKKKKDEEEMTEKKDISWGNQIRSYTLQPYTLVKDHRTKHENTNYEKVFDGELDDFIFEMIKLDFKQKYHILHEN